MFATGTRNSPPLMTEAPLLLIVDPHDLLRSALADQLAAQGFAPIQARSAAEALSLASANPPDLLLLDAKPGGMDAAELIEALRRLGVTAPALVLGGPVDGAAALAKPYRLGGLVAKLHELARLATAEATWPLGGFAVHPSARQAIDGQGHAVRLTEKETAILVYLHRAGERVVPREELLGEVWGYAGDASTHTVETHIYRLSRKLEGDGTPLLLTEPGGYRLV